MATNIDISFEIEQADNIIQNCIVLLADSYLMGYQGLIIEYTSVISIVRVAKDYLEYSITFDVEHDNVSKAVYIIREFLKYGNITSNVDYFTIFGIEVCVGETNSEQVVPGGQTPVTPIVPTNPTDPNNPNNPFIPSIPPTTGDGSGDDDNTNNDNELKSGTNMDFREYVLPITSDGQNTFSMPFDVTNVDKEYITMVVGGDNPKYTTTGVGFHMEGTNLYWHGDYPLRVDYTAVVKYVVGTF